MKTLIVLLGPTGVGKTEVSLRLAEQFRCPILSADSRQLYKDLPVGTAAPTAADLQRIRHYFVGTLELSDYYSASRFEEDAIALLSQLHETHDTVIMSGGSMMYIDAVCKGIDDLPTIDETLREEIRSLYEKEGLEPIRQRLKILDPVFYKQVDLKNPQRVIHALEICLMTGKPYSALRTQSAKERPFHILKIGLNRDRNELYDRINRRVDQMMANGLLDEARRVYPFRRLNALNTVGYKELFQYFAGEWELAFAVEKIKQNSRIYARKQLTWFKRDKDIVWYHPDEARLPDSTFINTLPPSPTGCSANLLSK
ncbi:MAG: tRNA (adenosine(37)-N6)-dimethylallyltransferase MiaA [Dysgonamonadaceae bacterium]|nr:tRNA (adenosine(37)-N6)-dimethylallyltransferase MiaA [Dysgonamonadaceae bacterium]